VVRRIDYRRAQHSSLRSDAASALTALDLDWQQEGELIKILNESKAISLLDIELCDAESTRIRELISTGESIPTEWLPAEVLDYINTAGLYRRREPE
jgi:nicotinic acid mononucleotide adenylyltransferase